MTIYSSNKSNLNHDDKGFFALFDEVISVIPTIDPDANESQAFLRLLANDLKIRINRSSDSSLLSISAFNLLKNLSALDNGGEEISARIWDLISILVDFGFMFKDEGLMMKIFETLLSQNMKMKAILLLHHLLHQPRFEVTHPMINLVLKKCLNTLDSNSARAMIDSLFYCKSDEFLKQFPIGVLQQIVNHCTKLSAQDSESKELLRPSLFHLKMLELPDLAMDCTVKRPLKLRISRGIANSCDAIKNRDFERIFAQFSEIKKEENSFYRASSYNRTFHDLFIALNELRIQCQDEFCDKFVTNLHSEMTTNPIFAAFFCKFVASILLHGEFVSDPLKCYEICREIRTEAEFSSPWMFNGGLYCKFSPAEATQKVTLNDLVFEAYINLLIKKSLNKIAAASFLQEINSLAFSTDQVQRLGR